MIWYNNLTTCKKMFSGLSNIIKIDLSKFISSSVYDMSYMFADCSSLKILNLSNLHTESVKTMEEMFSGCNSLENLDISNFNTTLVANMTKMFYNCGSLTSLNVSKLNTTLVTKMSYLFYGCQSLTSLDLSSFSTSDVTDISGMFEECRYLISLDLSHFVFNNLELMNFTFRGCSSLQSLDLSNFDTRNTKYMTEMFSGCSSLTSLNISTIHFGYIENLEKMFYNCSSLKTLDVSHFETKYAQNMNAMFSGCSSITSLDLSKFNTANLKYINSMFSNCSSLEFLDLSNFKTSLITDMDSLFYGCSSLKSVNLTNFDISSVWTMSSMFYGCSNLTSLDLSYFNTSYTQYMNEIFSGCSSLTYLDLSSFNTSKVISMEKMFSGCRSLISLDLFNFNTESVEDMNNMFSGCFNLSIINIPFNTNKVKRMDHMFSNCSSLISVDLSTFRTSSVTNMAHMFENCIELESINLSLFDISKVSDMNNMFNNCQNLQYINLENAIELATLDVSNMFRLVTENIIYCIKEQAAPKIYNLLKNKPCSIKYCSYDWQNLLNSSVYSICNDVCNVEDFFQGTCQNNNSNIEDREIIGKKMINDIMDGNMDNLLVKIMNNSNLIIRQKGQIYQLSTISTQKKNSNNSDNIIVIDLGDCENILKEAHGIDQNEEIIIFKIDNNISGINIPIVEYTLFSKDGKNKLNLDYCDETPIQYYIPVKINESDLYKYDSSSDFYNDICYTYSSEDGTDMTLYDRKNEYNNNNLSLCENNCKFKGYNSQTSKVECECKIKNNINFFSDIQIDKSQLIGKLISIKKISSIWVVKCFKLVFSLEGFILNIGSYILLLIILISIICSILFCKKGYFSLADKMKKIIEKKFNYSFNNDNNNINNNNNNDGKINVPPLKSRNKNSFKSLNTQNNLLTSNNNVILNSESNNINNKISNEQNDYELNSLSYNDAIKFDQRSYLDYYFSLIKTKQLLIFTFYTFNDYNSRVIKICLFFFSFAFFLVVNALFFSDSTMHQIYKDQGAFNFGYQIPQILYSTIISYVFTRVLAIIFLSEQNIIEIKNQETLEKAINEMNNILKCLFRKFLLFFIFIFIFLTLFWYYISSFCAVYKNTQLYLIKNSVISFGLALIFPFVINLIPGLFRIPSIKYKNKACMYITSKIIQLI